MESRAAPEEGLLGACLGTDVPLKQLKNIEKHREINGKSLES